jgi:alkylated DNA repair protein alkB family protein 6
MDVESYRVAGGQFFIANWISQEEEQILLQQIDQAPKPKWTNLRGRRLQNWGGIPGGKQDGNGVMLEEPIPSWLSVLCNRLHETLQKSGEPLFFKPPNHVLINEYLPGQGIMVSINNDDD